MPTIFFGLGATKAGTSWLHDYLSAHPEVKMPVAKELHYYDARFRRRVPDQLAKLDAIEADLQARLDRAGDPAAQGRLTQRLSELRAYRPILAATGSDMQFRDFLTNCGQDARVVGDITPAYALLPPRVLARMQNLGTQVRFLYILRDPIDRLWSNVRMRAGQTLRDGADLATHAYAIFDQWLSGDIASLNRRTDYVGILRRLQVALAPENLRLMFYERLFTPEAIGALCAFLGLTARKANFGKLVHAGIPVPLDDARRLQARVLLRPQYDFVRRRLGDLPTRWRENMGDEA